MYSHLERYENHIRKKKLFLILITLTIAVAGIAAIMIGSYELGFLDVLRTLFGIGSAARHHMVVFNLRLPRIIAAVVAGAGLSVAGCVMQIGLKNPLASPSTLGISSAAIFGANLAIILATTISGVHSGIAEMPYLTTLFAFLFAMGSTLAILMLSKMKGFTPQAIILAGVAISALFNAMTTLVQYFADETELSKAIFWTFGDLSRIGWHALAILSIVVGLASLYFYRKRWDYNALANGNDTARSLGVDVSRVRFVSLFLAALITAVSVAFLGMISFVGLLGPHIMRRIIGHDHRFLIPGSMLLGSLVLLLADMLSRSLLSPIVLPVGAITSMLGAPLFLYILFKGRMRYAH